MSNARCGRQSDWVLLVAGSDEGRSHVRMLRVELLLGEPYSASADLRTGRDTGSLVVHELEGDRALGRMTLVIL